MHVITSCRVVSLDGERIRSIVPYVWIKVLCFLLLYHTMHSFSLMIQRKAQLLSVRYHFMACMWLTKSQRDCQGRILWYLKDKKRFLSLDQTALKSFSHSIRTDMLTACMQSCFPCVSYVLQHKLYNIAGCLLYSAKTDANLPPVRHHSTLNRKSIIRTHLASF